MLPIEVDRAGETGREFVAGADEVRKLTEKTKDVAKKVVEHINSIQQSTQQNIKEVSLAVGNIRKQTRLDASGVALTGVGRPVSEPSTVVDQLQPRQRSKTPHLTDYRNS